MHWPRAYLPLLLLLLLLLQVTEVVTDPADASKVVELKAEYDHER